MPIGDTPDFLDGLDEPPPAFPPELPDFPFDALPPLPDAVDLTVTPLPAPAPLPAPPALTPPPVRAVSLDPPAAPAPFRVVRSHPSEVEQADGTLHVRMLVAADAHRDASDVVVRLPVPDRVKRVTANRPMRSLNGELVWELGELMAGEEVELRAKFTLTSHARRVDPPTYELSYSREPAGLLIAELTGPSEVPVGVPFVARFKLTNGGELPTADIRVSASGPAGPVGPTAELAPLAPGEDAAFEISLTAEWGGPTTWRVDATAGSTSAAAEYTTQAVTPEIAVSLTHEKTVLADAETDVAVTVTNRSAVAVRNVGVWLDLPDELAAKGQSGRRIEWPAADLPAGATLTHTVRVRGHAPGLAWLRAGADSGGGLSATTGGSLWCEIDPRAAGSSLDAVLTAVQSSVPDEWQRPTAEAITGERHVLFDLAGSRFAVPIGQVREVIRPPAVTPVPGTPDWLVGLTNVRGDVVSVVDLSSFLQLTDNPVPNRRGMLIAHTADGEVVVGLLVDEVASIRRLPTDGPALPPGLDDDRVTPFLAGVCEHQQRLIPRLDLERLLRSDELHALTTA